MKQRFNKGNAAAKSAALCLATKQNYNHNFGAQLDHLILLAG